MKRLKRIIFNGVTVISMLLFVAAAVLWVRSYWITDTIFTQVDSGQCFEACSLRGVFYVNSPQFQARAKAGSGLWHDPVGPNFMCIWDRPQHHFGGFSYSKDDIFHWIGIPMWFVVLLLSLTQAVGLVCRSRRLGHNVGNLCSVCGYNLTGNLSGVCPECGASPPLKATT